MLRANFAFFTFASYRNILYFWLCHPAWLCLVCGTRVNCALHTILHYGK